MTSRNTTHTKNFRSAAVQGSGFKVEVYDVNLGWETTRRGRLSSWQRHLHPPAEYLDVELRRPVTFARSLSGTKGPSAAVVSSGVTAFRLYKTLQHALYALLKCTFSHP